MWLSPQSIDPGLPLLLLHNMDDTHTHVLANPYISGVSLELELPGELQGVAERASLPLLLHYPG